MKIEDYYMSTDGTQDYYISTGFTTYDSNITITNDNSTTFTVSENDNYLIYDGTKHEYYKIDDKGFFIKEEDEIEGNYEEWEE